MTANLHNDGEQIVSARDNVVIRSVLETIRGGRTLDVTGFTPTIIEAGHVIIMETATKVHKPMPVNAGVTAYQALPSGHEYVGILIATIRTKRPFAAILLRGSVNPAAMAVPLGSIESAVKGAVPLITFRPD